MALVNAQATTFTFGTDGNDIINAQYMLGDLIDGKGGNDTITGLDGSDWLYGGAGRDTIYGMGGHDVLDGGAGNDRLYGGTGNDVLRPDSGGTGDDFMDGGADIDTVEYSNAAVTRGIKLDLRITTAQYTGGAGRDTIRNVENVVGTNFNDTIIGNDADNFIMAGEGGDALSGGNGNDNLLAGFGDFNGDTLNGGAGNDNLSGGYGADTLNGGTGNDALQGGLGADVLTGGAGIDQFRFDLTTDSDAAGMDTIMDFNGAEDTIFINPLSWAINPQDTAFIGSAAFSNAGHSEIRATYVGITQLVEIDIGGNGSVDMMLRVNGTALALDDFVTGGLILL